MTQQSIISKGFISPLFFIFLVLTSMGLVLAVQLNNPSLPLIQTDKTNLTTNVNNSNYLDGHPASDFYLASNPNAYISDGNSGWDNIYGFITNIIGLEIDPHSWKRNDSTETGNFTTSGSVKASMGNFTELYTSNGTLHIGNVSMSSASNVLTVEQGIILNATSFVGEGSRLFNLSLTDANLTNVTIIGGTINATAVNSNFTGYFFGVYDWIAQSPYLSFNGTYLSFNQTKLNETISAGVVKAYETNLTLTTSGNQGTNSTSATKSFLLTQIIVTPNNLTNSYMFEMKTGSGNMLDRNRVSHVGVWNIEKNLAFNDTFVVNITNATVDDAYNIQIKYLDNFKP